VPEASYGIIVEGTYDEAMFAELVRRIASPQMEPTVRVCGGWSHLMKLFPDLLRDLEHVRQGKPVDKALVIRDWKGPSLNSCEERMVKKVSTKRFFFPRGVQFCCVRQEMETWLLADVNAINSLARERGGRTVPALTGQLEEIGNAKEEFRRLLGRAGLPYDPEVCREIASRLDLQVLRNRCPSFRSFERRVLDC
jgi:hypothetical protein